MKKLSRSFSLSLLTLPAAERPVLSRAYLVARYADTLVDSGVASPEARSGFLDEWQNALETPDGAQRWREEGLFSKGDFWKNLTAAEQEFLRSGTEILSYFHSLPARALHLSQQVVHILISGMKWDLATFTGGSPQTVIFGVEDEAAFDLYCHKIAGCVGPFWAEIFSLNERAKDLAEAYGRGLQRVNILRDVVEDWQRGRVYLPISWLQQFHVSTDGKTPPWQSERWSEFVQFYCERAFLLLNQGAEFCDQIRRSQWRVRWASALPMMIGIKTLQSLKTYPARGEWPEHLKISRREVKRIAMVAAWRVMTAQKFGRYN